jgi:hypothetical protein
MLQLTDKPLVFPESQPHKRSLLALCFWMLLLVLLSHQLLIVLPAYYYGIVAAYTAGAHLKELHFAVPGYTPYSMLTNMLLFLSVLMVTLVWWVAPVASLLWGVGLWRNWSAVSLRAKWLWLATIVAVWTLTILTKTASDAFFIWVMD